MLVEFVLLAVCLISIYFYFNGTKRLPNYPDGPSGLPYIGNFHQIGNEPQLTFMKMQKKFGDIFSLKLGDVRVVVLNDPKLIRDAFAEPNFSGRANFLEPIKQRSKGTPRGIIFTDREVWTEQRRFTLKTLRDFGFGKKSMEELILEEAVELTETFRKGSGLPLDTQNRFSAAVLNGLWKIMTGHRYQHNDPDLLNLTNGIAMQLRGGTQLSAFLIFPIVLKFRKLFPSLFGEASKSRAAYDKKRSEFITRHIKEHQSSFKPDEDEPRDYIDVYLAEIEKAKNVPTSSFHGEVGILNLTYSMVDLFVAGSETTSTTLTWTFLLFAMYPDIQEQFYQEIKKIVGTSRLPSLRDREQMPYVQATMMEVMRFSAMVPLGNLHATLEDVEFHGYVIPKETIVIANQYACLKEPKIWGDPDVFRPERFLSSDKKSVLRHEAFIPFSIGRRVCLGETLARDEFFLFATTLCQKLRVAQDPKGPKLNAEYCPGVVLIPKPHLLMIYDREN